MGYFARDNFFPMSYKTGTILIFRCHVVTTGIKQRYNDVNSLRNPLLPGSMHLHFQPRV